VCGKFLITSILVLLIQFGSPLEKYQKKYSKKTKKKEAKKKQEDNIEGVLCVFSFLLCGGAL
jgi:Na+-transporting methylmalonyl-CoA/oxaloacetate decarboxylase gamma subunit